VIDGLDRLARALLAAAESALKATAPSDKPNKNS
jgi:hypothetical protein